jgi:hypothetical protein
MGSTGDEKVDEIAQEIISKIEKASSKELAESNEMIEILHLTNVHHAKTLLQHMDEAPSPVERDIGKKSGDKSIASLYLAPATLLHNKILHHGHNRRHGHVPLHTALRFHKRQAANSLGHVYVRVLAGRVKTARRADSQSHKRSCCLLEQS